MSSMGTSTSENRINRNFLAIVALADKYVRSSLHYLNVREQGIFYEERFKNSFG